MNCIETHKAYFSSAVDYVFVICLYNFRYNINLNVDIWFTFILHYNVLLFTSLCKSLNSTLGLTEFIQYWMLCHPGTITELLSMDLSPCFDIKFWYFIIFNFYSSPNTSKNWKWYTECLRASAKKKEITEFFNSGVQSN